MARPGRSRAMVGVALLGLCVPAAGCVTTASQAFQPPPTEVRGQMPPSLDYHYKTTYVSPPDITPPLGLAPTLPASKADYPSFAPAPAPFPVPEPSQTPAATNHTRAGNVTTIAYPPMPYSNATNPPTSWGPPVTSAEPRVLSGLTPAGTFTPDPSVDASVPGRVSHAGLTYGGSPGMTPAAMPLPGMAGLMDGPMCGMGPIPTELNKSSHPSYTVSPPDILIIDAIRLVPRPPYRIEPMEALIVNVAETLPNEPIAGPYVVSPEGSINLGFRYGPVRVSGLTVAECQDAIRKKLSQAIKNPQVTVALAQFRGMQQIAGHHLVRQDGTISLGTYGEVYVAGLTLCQVKAALEQHLGRFLCQPQISVDVFAYNSKKYYVIFDGGGYGQHVFAFPITGNETVLDAVSMVQGLAPVSSKRRIWVARPAPAGWGCAQVLPVDWRAVTEGGVTRTNYQLFPGDRVYVAADCFSTFDNWMAKIFGPVERLLGVSFLGASTYWGFNNGFTN